MGKGGGRKDADGAKEKRVISQEAFNDLVKENMEELGMDPAEALQDAFDTLSLQNVDLSGIVMIVPGEGSPDDDPTLESIRKLETYSKEEQSSPEVLDLFCQLSSSLISSPSSASIAVKNRGIEVIWSACLNLPFPSQQEVLASGLKLLSNLIYDLQGTEKFRSINGPEKLLHFLKNGSDCATLLEGGFSLVASAAKGNEVTKEIFINSGIEDLILNSLNQQLIPVYDTIRVLLTPDDNRVLASQVYGYARKFAEIGIPRTLTASLASNSVPNNALSPAMMALKAAAVNDEICKSIAEAGGVDAILRCTGRGDAAVAKACCAMLCKLAGSDANKAAIVERGGVRVLMEAAGDAAAAADAMAVMAAVSLRAPENAARVVAEGGGEFAVEAMERFPAAAHVQRSACLMIRNLVARNPENRRILLCSGVERLVRKAKESHVSCREAANDALRDLGLEYSR